MVILSNISLPVFSVLKYIIVFSFIDVLVRVCINNLNTFCRKYSISNGRSVPIGGTAFDRFSVSSHSFPKLSFLSMIVVLISLFTYAIELILEFSTDSFVVNISKPEVLEVQVENHGTCTLGEVTDVLAAEYMSQVGNNCVVYSEEDQMYTLYAPLWVREGGRIALRCIQTDDNELAREAALYANENLARVQSDFVDEMRKHSYGANGDKNRYLITITARSTDVLAAAKRTQRDGNFVTGPLVVKIPNTAISCIGNVHGRIGDGQMKAELHFCLKGGWPSNDQTDFIYMLGSALIPEDAKSMNADWEVKIAISHGREIKDFGKGIVSGGLFRYEAYGAFLGLTTNQDVHSIQRYAIVYKYCDVIKIPGRNSIWERRLEPKAKSVSSVRVQVKDWAIILIVSWPLFLCILVGLTQLYSRGRELPQMVSGEDNIAMQWYSDLRRRRKRFHDDEETETGKRPETCVTCRPFFCKKKSKDLFLSVDPGPFEDRVTVTSSPKIVPRTMKKPFESIGI